MGSERKYPLHEALVRLEAYCAYQDRCNDEVLKKTSAWGLNLEEGQELLDELIEKGFVDEARFTESFVSGKFRYKKWGRIKIRYELKKKRIPETLIKKSISEIDPEQYYTVLRELGNKKWQDTKGKDQWDKKAKVMRFLASKGYETDLINDVLQEISQSN
jgi:regulatory protein